MGHYTLTEWLRSTDAARLDTSGFEQYVQKLLELTSPDFRVHAIAYKNLYLLTDQAVHPEIIRPELQAICAFTAVDIHNATAQLMVIKLTDSFTSRIFILGGS